MKTTIYGFDFENLDLDESIEILRFSFENNIKFEELEAIYLEALFQMFWILKANQLLKMFDNKFQSNYFTKSQYETIMSKINNNIEAEKMKI